MTNKMDMIPKIHTQHGVSPTSTDTDARLKRACADFESIFIYYMFKSMRKSLPQNGLLDNTQEQKLYKSMADQAMSENIARGRAMGLGKLLYNQLRTSSKY
jgi:flagellar protein FlgJ